jgi:hypothetical protein
MKVLSAALLVLLLVLLTSRSLVLAMLVSPIY